MSSASFCVISPVIVSETQPVFVSISLSICQISRGPDQREEPRGREGCTSSISTIYLSALGDASYVFHHLRDAAKIHGAPTVLFFVSFCHEVHGHGACAVRFKRHGQPLARLKYKPCCSMTCRREPIFCDFQPTKRGIGRVVLHAARRRVRAGHSLAQVPRLSLFGPRFATHAGKRSTRRRPAHGLTRVARSWRARIREKMPAAGLETAGTGGQCPTRPID